MESKFFKVYVDGKLRVGCGNQFTLMSNVVRLHQQYGKERVKIVECTETIPFTKEELEEMKEVIQDFRNI
ncbi:MAG: hypothetical protein ACRDDY_16155 [Clostridium sp.]|uniref:hypothetical protein n=1 Tax=Clostridium sp. TaxID=1506 RepID=UPI003EE4428E